MTEYAAGCRPKLAELLECLGLDVTYTRARGAYLYRAGPAGQEIPVLDLVGGFGAGLLGHNNPELREVLKSALDAEVPFLAQSAVRREAGRLAERLNGALPTRRPYVCHLTNSGAEAVEAALKHAYKVRFDRIRRQFDRVSRQVERFHATAERECPDCEIPGTAVDLGAYRDDVDEHNLMELERFQHGPVALAFKGAFHGKTAGALKLTFNRTYREGFEGLSAIETEFIDFADVERLEAIVHDHRIEFLVPHVRDGRIVLERESASRVIALCLEIVQGEGGVRIVPDAVLASLAAQHERLDVPYLVDEIQTGCGRTGSFVAFGAGPLAAIDPEYVTLSKALGGGLVKVGATLIRDDVYDPDFGILHTSTFAEDELGCLVAGHVVEMLTRDGGRLMSEVAEKGEYLLRALEGLRERFPRVLRDVRGRGLMAAVEFADMDDRSPFFRFGSRQGFLSLLIASYLLHRRGIRILAPLSTLLKGNPGKKRHAALRVQPPVDVTRAEIDDLVDALAEVCRIVERNNEGMLVAHLLDLPLTDRERRDPPTFRPARRTARRVEFDARIGFVMHPSHVDQVLGFYFPSLLGRVDPARLEAWWSRLSRFLEPDVVHTDYTACGGFVVETNVVAIPYLPRDLVAAHRAEGAPGGPSRAEAIRLQEIRDRIQDAVTVARELGDDHVPTSVVGLGGYTSIVTDRGTTVNDFETPVTTGNAYTAGLMIQGIREAASRRGLHLGGTTAAVVGAGGNIGSVLAVMLSSMTGTLRLVGSCEPGSLHRLGATRRDCLRHLALRIRADVLEGCTLDEVRPGGVADGLLDRVLLPALREGSPLGERIGRWLHGPQEGADELVALLEAEMDRRDAEGPPLISLHQSMEAVRGCGVVTVATSSPQGRLVSPELVSPGAVVACASIPSNLSAAFRDHLDAYTVFDGGHARLPEGQGIDFFGLPHGLAFGCLSETLLLGFEGNSRSFALGPITVEQVEETLCMAERWGFTLGDLKLNESAHSGPRHVRAA
jgi:acetylornithine/succinyldiaminopimelate/putrescine aminotransferase/predicted amino acid dehydrogenase